MNKSIQIAHSPPFSDCHFQVLKVMMEGAAKKKEKTFALKQKVMVEAVHERVMKFRPQINGLNVPR